MSLLPLLRGIVGYRDQHRRSSGGRGRFSPKTTRGIYRTPGQHPAGAMEEIPMTNLVTYTRTGPISRIIMDDGKVNVMSIDMLEALHDVCSA